MRYSWLSVAMIGVICAARARNAPSQPVGAPGGVLAGQVLSSPPPFFPPIAATATVVQAHEKPGGPVKVAGAVMAANLVEKPEPICSPEHKGDHVSGTVVLDAIIGVDGRVANLNVISGPEALRGCVLDAVSQWVYKPYLVNGVAVEVETVITLNLDSGGV